MTLFLALCGLLAALALALLLVPLLRARAHQAPAVRAGNSSVYREQLAELDAELHAGTLSREQWAAARGEIERRALDEAGQAEPGAQSRSPRLVPIAIGVAVPVVAVALYALLGNPQALLPESGAESASAHAVTPQQIEPMVAKLAARLESEPGNTEGWIMLGRSYGVLGRFQQASAAYEKAAQQRPDDAQLLADYADMLAMAQGRDLSGKPEALIARALKADGNNVKALALAGTAAFERRDYSGALGHWRKILTLTPEDSEFGQSIRSGIQEAENHLRGTPADGTPAPVAKADALKREGASLQGKVSLAAAAAGNAQPDDAVFVYARAAEGSRMPLAVLRRKVRDLPFEFSLDDSMAMNPSHKLSDFDKVVVVARVSKSGQPTPQKGDLEVMTVPVAPGTKGLRLDIARALD